MRCLVKILLAKNALFPLDYIIEYEKSMPEIGSFVKAPLRKDFAIGIIWQITEDEKDLGFDIKKLKIISSEDILNVKLNAKTLIFLEKISNYYISSLGSTLKLFVPIKLDFIKMLDGLK